MLALLGEIWRKYTLHLTGRTKDGFDFERPLILDILFSLVYTFLDLCVLVILRIVFGMKKHGKSYNNEFLDLFVRQTHLNVRLNNVSSYTAYSQSQGGHTGARG